MYKIKDYQLNKKKLFFCKNNKGKIIKLWKIKKIILKNYSKQKTLKKILKI
jgi:hypothetical protein